MALTAILRLFSSMQRVFIKPQAVQADSIAINDPTTLHHLLHVLRVGVGDRLECFDGQGTVFSGAITRISSRLLTFSIEQRRQEPPPLLRLTLAQVLIKPECFEWVIQKATELGVGKIVPVISQRSRVRPSSGGRRLRFERWQRIIEAAAAQSGRSTVPLLEEPTPLERVLETSAGSRLLLPTLTEEGIPLKGCFPNGLWEGAVTLMIGPEGDFSREEIALAKRYDAQLVRFGRRVLRSETAAIAILAVLQHSAGLL